MIVYPDIVALIVSCWQMCFLFASQIQIDMSSSSTRDVQLRAEVLPESPSPLIELEEKDPVGDTQLMDSDTQTWAEGMKRDAMPSCFGSQFWLGGRWFALIQKFGWFLMHPGAFNLLLQCVSFEVALYCESSPVLVQAI